MSGTQRLPHICTGYSKPSNVKADEPLIASNSVVSVVTEQRAFPEKTNQISGKTTLPPTAQLTSAATDASQSNQISAATDVIVGAKSPSIFALRASGSSNLTMKSSDEDSEFKKVVSSTSGFRTRSRSTSIYETSKSSCYIKPDHPESKALFFADPDGHLTPDEVGKVDKVVF